MRGQQRSQPPPARPGPRPHHTNACCYRQAANESEFKLWQKALLRHMKYEGRHPPQDPEARRAMRRRHQERREREAAERRAEAEARRAVERQGSGPWEGGEGEEVEVEDAEEEDDDEEEGARDRYGRPALWRRLVGQTPERRACRGGARVNPLTRAGTAWESLAGGASANGLRGWRKGRGECVWCGLAFLTQCSPPSVPNLLPESRERARLKASSAAMASRAGRLHRLARQRGHAAGSWPSSGAGELPAIPSGTLPVRDLDLPSHNNHTRSRPPVPRESSPRPQAARGARGWCGANDASEAGAGV